MEERRIASVFFLFGVLSLLIGATNLKEDQQREEPHLVYAPLARSLLGRVTSSLEQKYDIQACVVCTAMMDCVRKMGVWFNVDRMLTLDESRELLFDCARSYLDAFNPCENLCPYMIQYPFTSENLDVGLYFHTVEGGQVYRPYPSAIGVTKGKVLIWLEDRGEKFSPDDIITETYEEALEKVKTSSLQGNDSLEI